MTQEQKSEQPSQELSFYERRARIERETEGKYTVMPFTFAAHIMVQTSLGPTKKYIETAYLVYHPNTNAYITSALNKVAHRDQIPTNEYFFEEAAAKKLSDTLNRDGYYQTQMNRILGNK